ncbi:hypothetical protein GUITHDRAFT_116557 [Guillardia theta CCMP2712]|uniref:PI3K/PI4K catalytic domain-containing protein n=1 Tax=Guillardia theta (strain CCMP2712) TaxID=905079 RepID=L1IN39_GUITC|nr:hypothetical protein GUITHDRAFT_116557 [Guillardia theta CCMP2712]EKX37289.1 hypothetical protein GUITHDRAFT_116557 [Guillardia theta CCMP2712]|eukprot:XP_005824269.1 hypothetical protein GUITHDRAFT_116557 [Guillardia theta CCMP2712]
MGGQQSQHYRLFQQYCSEAYIILRRRAEFFINLMMLMKDANIPDISGVPGRPEDPERQLYKMVEWAHKLKQDYWTA